MKLIMVGAAALNQTPLDWPGNLANIEAAIDQARDAGVSILVLPEMSISGYGCEDAFLAPEVPETSMTILKEILPQTRGMIVALGLPVRHQNGLFNCAALVVDGEIAGFAGKRHLAGDGIHYEPRWFKPWPAGRCATLRTGGKSYPIGDIHFRCGEVKIGFEICEDAWVAKRPGADLSLRAVDIILNPNASHFAFDKVDIRRRYTVEGSRAFGVAYISTNPLGNEAGRAIYDGHNLIASGGRMMAEGPRMRMEKMVLTTSVIDLEENRTIQARTASFEPDVEDHPELCIEAPFHWPSREPQPPHLDSEDWEGSPRRKAEEFSHALTLSLFDYLRKSHSQGFVVSLSGGADSSAVAVLVAQMVERAVAELGIERLQQRLDHIPDLPGDERAIVGRLLTTVYQSTRNSSEQTRQSARTIAEAIGATHYELDVDGLVDGYVERIEAAIGRKLTWKTDDITLQNIQARVRAPSAWMLANIQNSLLLATSNRSEAAVGYATMDGDTAGGLSPIAGIDKAFLLKWLLWMETAAPEGLRAIPALAVVNALAPTAELRPADDHQSDEGDLMPYILLDAVEKAAIRDKRMPVEVWRLMKVRFGQYEPRQLAAWIDRFFRLWSKNQWKRERYAPSFHLDDENLDPKTWCRFPILSGNFVRELKQLEEVVAKELPS